MLNRMGSHWLTIGHGEPLGAHPARNRKLHNLRCFVLLPAFKPADDLLSHAGPSFELLLGDLGYYLPRVAQSLSEVHDVKLHRLE